MYKKNHTPHEKPLIVSDDQGNKKRNPNEITVNQHVIPQAHLKEWAREDGLLNVFDKQKQSWITPAPQNAFVVQRLWDQWTETTFLGTNERNYLNQADLIKASQPIESNEHISAYFFMLCIRAAVAAKERPDYPSFMEFSSPPPTQSELEEIELRNVGSSVHLAYPGGDGSQNSAREAVKMAMNMTFIREVPKFKGTIWTPFSMENEDAVLPDSLVGIDQSGLAILPVTPKIVLIGSGANHCLPNVTKLNPTSINEMLVEASVKYYVASNQHSA